MLKRTARLLLSIAITLLLQGCVVFSLDPFYTEASKTTLPAELTGNWSPLQLEGDPVKSQTLSPWMIGDGSTIAYDENNTPGELESVFFRVNGRLFCDTRSGSPDNKRINQYWLYHLSPFHSVSRVDRGTGTLTFTPLNYDWLETQIENGTVNLPHIVWKSEKLLLFTASAEQWEQFLVQYGENREAFPAKHAFVLSRGDAPGQPQPSPQRQP